MSDTEAPISESSKPLLSIVVPMHNEEEGADYFFSRVEPILENEGYDYEIICVNDGSRDNTLQVLRRHQQRNPRVKIVNLARNFGKDTALTAGLDYTTGRAVIPIDADLQDPPEVIPQMLKLWQEGWDVVYGTRAQRDSDSWLKRTTAGKFYKFFNSISEIRIPENTGDFRLMDERVIAIVRTMREKNRFMKGIFTWVGFRQTQVTYAREARILGTTKWNYWKLWNFALSGILAFSTIPLRIWSYVGLFIAFLSFLYAIYVFGKTILFGDPVAGYPSLMIVILCLGGLQLFTLGIIGEYLGRIYLEVKDRPLYIVRETYGFTENQRH